MMEFWLMSMLVFFFAVKLRLDLSLCSIHW